MEELEIVPQIEFSRLEEFVNGQNNFFIFFLNDCFSGRDFYRQKAVFKRFQETYPEMEKELTELTTKSKRFWKKLPYVMKNYLRRIK